MSIISTVFLKNYIIMSSDCRLTASKEINGVNKTKTVDRLPKTFLIKNINVGISYCGNARVSGQLFHEFIKDFSKNNLTDSDNVISVAEKLTEYTDNSNTIIMVCGFFRDISYVFCVYDGKISRVNENNETGELIYYYLNLGASASAKEFFNEKYRGKFLFENLSLFDGIKVAEEMVEVAINNECSCGYPISTLILGNNCAKWFRMNCMAQDVLNENTF